MTKEDISVLKAFTDGYIEAHTYFRRDVCGNWVDTIYADYRDELDDASAQEIVESDCPDDAFSEKMFAWYGDAEWDHKHDLIASVKDAYRDSDIYSGELADAAEEWIEDYIRDNAYCVYPDDHFLKQELYVNIIMDTGDGNYDFTLNSLYPCWCGEEGEKYSDKASLIWLAKQQGYGKRELRKALEQGDMSDPHGFLESCRVELANLPSHMSAVTFLVKMTLDQLMDLNEAIHWCEKHGHRYDPIKTPYAGYIVLDKKTMCGLYDSWSGGGSVLEIELEKDVKLPIKYIWRALPDGAKDRGYQVGDVYGMCGSAWKDTLKKMQIPRKVWDPNYTGPSPKATEAGAA